MRPASLLLGLLAAAASPSSIGRCAAFAPPVAPAARRAAASPLGLGATSEDGVDGDCDGDGKINVSGAAGDRRAFLSSASAAAVAAAASSVGLVGYSPSAAYADEDGGGEGESIVERAARISKQISVEEQEERIAEDRRMVAARERLAADTRTIYDFTLPVKGVEVPFGELVGQEYGPDREDGSRGDPKVKAVLVVNIKQDDVVARKNIPELIALAQKYGKNGEFAVVCCPTDQGYYEPDTSALIRLKLASEYGYGNPNVVANVQSTIITDKVNLLGTGSIPFWRWIQGRVRTPSGLGRIQANFEKFLVDMRTGQPVRRYPRKYFPYDMKEDVEALVKGKPLPPLTAEWREEWRTADRDAERDTYRFQKGLNVFDQ
mmetsp:Transcript_36310/g.108928  ORF Transcript_36310/g.108928 Transcript_36310/m.108928 type:complete len:376 (-) Transcript_36310:92-1219(-)